MDNILKEHIRFIEHHYYDNNEHKRGSNIGWVTTEDSVTSKIYSTRELITTKKIAENDYDHTVEKL